jgi:CRP/FNR family transcriptional regulator, cyclic AMP receptor protein
MRVPELIPYAVEHALRDHPFARDLHPAHVERLKSCAHTCTFEAGDFLWRQGELANDLYLICSGEVSLEISIPHQGSVQIEAVGTGEALGWSWLAPHHRWQLDARAITPVVAFRLEGKCLFATMERNHDFGYQVLKRLTPVIARRLQTARSRVYQLCSLAVKDVCGK